MNWLSIARIMESAIVREQDGAPGAAPTLGERVMAYAGDSRANFTSFHDASADKDTEDGAGDTDHQGNQGETDDSSGAAAASGEDGQDTDLGEGEDENAEDTTGQELEDEQGDNKPKRQSLDERVAALVEKKLAELDSNRQEDVPNFAPPETVRAVVKNIFKWEKQAEEIKSELDLLEDDEWGEEEYSKASQLEKLRGTISEARAALKANEKAQSEWATRQAQKKAGKETEAEARARLDEVAELYRQEMKVNEKVWKQQGDWFQSQLKLKPLLVQEFNDKYRLGGPVEAIRFAHKYVTEHMGKDTKQKNDQRENNKTRSANAAGGSGGKAPVIDISKETAKIWASELPDDEKFIRVQELKRKAAGGS